MRYLKPFAERQQTPFNFRSVLKARMAYAKRRLEEKKKSEPSKPDSSAASLSDAVKPKPDGTRQSTIETIVREETMLDHPKRPRPPADVDQREHL